MAQDHIWGADNNVTSHVGGPVTTSACPTVAGKRALDVAVIKDSTGSEAPTTTTIANEDIVSANVEQSYSLPANTKEFMLRNRGCHDLRLAYSTGDTASGPYITIPGGSTYKNSNFYTSQTIYFQTTDADDVIEIEVHV